MKLFLLGLAILFYWALIMDLTIQAMHKSNAKVKNKKGGEMIHGFRHVLKSPRTNW